MNIDNNAMHSIVQAFTRSAADDLKQNSSENNFVTNIGEDLYSWNYIFGDIANAAQNHGLRYIVVDRSKIWNFVAVLSQDEEELLLFFKEKTLKSILSNIEDKPFHYLNCLLIKNMDLNGTETSYQYNLFEKYDTVEKEEIGRKRFVEAREMLNEDFDKIKRIYVCSKEEAMGTVSSVKMKLFTGYGGLVKSEDVTSLISLDYDTTSAVSDYIEKTPTIPKLKKEFKDKNKSTIPNQKRYEENENENK